MVHYPGSGTLLYPCLPTHPGYTDTHRHRTVTNSTRYVTARLPALLTARLLPGGPGFPQVVQASQKVVQKCLRGVFPGLF